ncbi:MAG: multidrug efflux RND transporter permease subunit [Rhodospirillaceae bacterium]|nr:multidrug efflux RND transporter permease subunit [Rhodospirillaceae bacterium]
MLSAFFIDRPRFAFVISIVITLAGIIALGVIPVAEYPDITPPQVRVTANYPGANSAIVRDTVAVPIEEQVNGVDDMLYMSSTSSNNGGYSLDVTFAVGTDPDIAAVNVQNRVAISNSQLPGDVTRDGVVTKKQSSNMLLVVNLVSPNGGRDALFLSNYSSIYLEGALSRINGVGSVSQFGPLNYGMRVWMNPDRMTALQLTSSDVADAIRSQNIQATAGQLGAPPFEGEPQFQFTIQAKGRLTTVKEFGNIVLRANTDGSFVRLRDVARIELGSQSYSSQARLNNKPATAIGVYQTPGANALDVADAVYAELDKLAQRFPPDVEYKIIYDTTRAVRASINEVVETMLITFLLVVAVTFLFLADWRSTLVPTLAIPVSLIGTFAVLFIVGFSINMITLFALILAIGVVVDDSIVVVENVQRLMHEENLSARDATLKAMQEITGPVVATTLVLLAVFVPVAFMPGVTGQLYAQFSVTICVAVTISSLNALTLAPALAAVLFKPGSGVPKGPLKWFSSAVDRTRNGYVRVVALMLRRLVLTLIVFGIFAGAAFMLFRSAPTGFLPVEDKGVLFSDIQLPDGASLKRTDEVVSRIVDMMRATDGVSDVISVSGVSLISGSASNAALAIVILDPWDKRTAPQHKWFRILGRINRQLAAIPEANAFAFPLPPIMGLGTSGGLEAELQDLEGQSPQALASAVRSLVFHANQTPEFARVFSTYSANVPQLFLDVDRDKAQVLGVSLAEIFSTLQANFGSSYINDFNLYGKVYRVNIQAEPNFRSDIEDINRLYIRNAKDEMVPLRTLVSVKPILGPIAIKRYNQFQSARINATPTQGTSTGEAITALENAARDALPPGYRLTWTGTAQQELEAGGLVAAIFALAVVFAYLFLVAQYESWSIPVSVVLSVIIAMLGALMPIALLPFLTFNLYAQIGMVMLIGLSAKSAILIVEFAKVRREAGLETKKAALEAARLRFRAVMMTALSFILGVSPLIIASGAGAASRVSVGFVVFFGMVAATFIGTFFIPPLYAAIQQLSDRSEPA